MENKDKEGVMDEEGRMKREKLWTRALGWSNREENGVEKQRRYWSCSEKKGGEKRKKCGR